MRAPGRHAGQKLTGIEELRGSVRVPVAVCCSGTTLRDFDPDWIPSWWCVVAVNEAIRKLRDRADFWVHSDRPISLSYGKYVDPRRTVVLAMHDAALYAKQGCPKHTKIYTTMSHAVVKAYDDGMNFYSRGTVLIGAVEMLRYMGAKRFYCFGVDCYREEHEYYYDGRKHPLSSETRLLDKERVRSDVPPGVRIWVTARLRRMIVKLDEAAESGLWDKTQLYCVNSPHSQQRALEHLSLGEFSKQVAKSEETRKRSERRRRAKAEAISPDDTAVHGPGGDAGDGNAGGSPSDPGDGGGGTTARPEDGEPEGGYGRDSSAGLRRDRDTPSDDGTGADPGTRADEADAAAVD